MHLSHATVCVYICVCVHVCVVQCLKKIAILYARTFNCCIAINTYNTTNTCARINPNICLNCSSTLWEILSYLHYLRNLWNVTWAIPILMSDTTCSSFDRNLAVVFSMCHTQVGSLVVVQPAAMWSPFTFANRVCSTNLRRKSHDRTFN